MDEASAAETERLRQWNEREAALAAAEAATRSELAAKKAALDKQTAETALALKEQRLKGASMRAERLGLAQVRRAPSVPRASRTHMRAACLALR